MNNEVSSSINEQGIRGANAGFSVTNTPTLRVVVDVGNTDWSKGIGRVTVEGFEPCGLGERNFPDDGEKNGEG
jgi:hypothetical protein